MREYADFLDDLDRDLNTTDEPQDIPGARGTTGVPTHPPTREDNARPAIGGMPGNGTYHIIAPPQVPYDQTAAGKAAIERVRRIAREWSFK